MTATQEIRGKVNKFLDQESFTYRVLFHTVPVYLIGILLSLKLDNSVIRSKQIFPWDSRVYFQLSKRLFSTTNYPINIDYPWGARIVFPFLYGLLEQILHLIPTVAAIIVNLVAVMTVSIFCTWYWKKIGISSRNSLLGVCILGIASTGPLRTTIFYPGNGYAVECAIAALTYFCIYSLKKYNTYKLFLIYFALFTLSLGREFSGYLVVLYSIIEIAKKIYLIFFFKKRVSPISNQVSIRKLLGSSISSILGILLTHVLTKDPRGDFPFVRAAFTNGWDHLNVFNATYPYFYALGTISLLIVLNFTFRIPIEKNFDRQVKSLGNFFATSGFVFSMVVGGDTDRFIWWFFPFFAGIGIIVFQNLKAIKALSNQAMIMLLLVTCLWSRAFLPAIPPILFVGEKLEAFASVRTDYEPSKFVGVPLLKSFRMPLKKFLYDDPLALNKGTRYLKNQSISLPVATQLNSVAVGKQSPVYKFRLNEYPIPFGYLHNQYEMFSLHPQHGERKAKIIYLFQWIILQFGITLGICRRSKLGFRRWG